MTKEKIVNNINKITNTIESMTKDSDKKRKIRNLASSLQSIANIDNSNSLVCIVGNGDERNNHEALQTWISRTFHLVDENYCDPLDYYYASLFSELDKYS